MSYFRFKIKKCHLCKRWHIQHPLLPQGVMGGASHILHIYVKYVKLELESI